MSAKASGKSPAADKMTIGELARRTGMTVRNIRAHQTRGLLPPPEVNGRTGYYGREHVALIELIKEMQAEGLNLAAIGRMLEGSGGSPREIVDFARALRAPFGDEAPEIIGADELAASWGAREIDPDLIRRAEELGILRPLPDGRIEVISPRLQHAGAALVELGIKPESALDVAETLHRQSEAVARSFVHLFVKEVWTPFQQADHPAEEWPRVREALDRLRPLASDALLAMFRLTMEEQTERASEVTLRGMSAEDEPKRPPRGRGAAAGGKARAKSRAGGSAAGATAARKGRAKSRAPGASGTRRAGGA